MIKYMVFAARYTTSDVFVTCLCCAMVFNRGVQRTYSTITKAKVASLYIKLQKFLYFIERYCS